VGLCVGEESRSLGLLLILNWNRYKIWKDLDKSGLSRLSVALKLYRGTLCQDFAIKYIVFWLYLTLYSAIRLL
jgi:hypothetical protein